MESLSMKVCPVCKNLDVCIETALCHPELVVKCIHFGYIEQFADSCNSMYRECVKSMIDNKE